MQLTPLCSPSSLREFFSSRFPDRIQRKVGSKNTVKYPKLTDGLMYSLQQQPDGPTHVPARSWAVGTASDGVVYSNASSIQLNPIS